MFSQDTGGAVLAFVTRVVTGNVFAPQARFDDATMKVTRTMERVVNPVIIFFPNGTTVVMAEKLAEQKGFLEAPTILNFEAVVDAKSIAGRFKFSMGDSARREAWTQMEQAVIGTCLARGGYPLNQKEASYSDHSIMFSKREAPETKMKEAV